MSLVLLPGSRVSYFVMFIRRIHIMHIDEITPANRQSQLNYTL